MESQTDDSNTQEGVEKWVESIPFSLPTMRESHNDVMGWYRKYRLEGEFLHGKKRSGSTCNNILAKDILDTQGKSKSDGSVLYYCDEGCKAVHSNEPDVLRDMKSDFFLCNHCYIDRMETLESSTKRNTCGGVRKSGRVRQFIDNIEMESTTILGQK